MRHQHSRRSAAFQRSSILKESSRKSWPTAVEMPSARPIRPSPASALACTAHCKASREMRQVGGSLPASCARDGLLRRLDLTSGAVCFLPRGLRRRGGEGNCPASLSRLSVPSLVRFRPGPLIVSQGEVVLVGGLVVVVGGGGGPHVQGSAATPMHPHATAVNPGSKTATAVIRPQYICARQRRKSLTHPPDPDPPTPRQGQLRARPARLVAESFLHLAERFGPRLTAVWTASCSTVVDRWRRGCVQLVIPVQFLHSVMTEYPDSSLLQAFNGIWPEINNFKWSPFVRFSNWGRPTT